MLRPYALVNMAMTADGKIDTVERRGARISGPADTARVDGLRAGVDAVLVGGNTLLREDPRLTVRDERRIEGRRARGKPDQPLKVGIVTLIGETGDEDGLPAGSDFLHAGGGAVLICTTSRTSAAAIGLLEGDGAEVVVHGEQRVDLAAAAAALAERGIERLLVEGGSTIVAALLEAGLVDEIQLAVAPIVVGGATAPTPVGGHGRAIDEAVSLRLESTDISADGDVVIRYLVGVDA